MDEDKCKVIALTPTLALSMSARRYRFVLEERKWQLRLRVFTPPLRSPLVIKEDVILTRHGGPTGLNLSVLLVRFQRGLWFHNEKPLGVSGTEAQWQK